jgi:bifunctional enzyme Fae/Hps
MRKRSPLLDPKERYLQVALNSTLFDARSIIQTLPRSERIIVEAGTPLIKRYGVRAISDIYTWYGRHLSGLSIEPSNQEQQLNLVDLFKAARRQYNTSRVTSQRSENTVVKPYVVADLKMMDRGETEVELAAHAGASAATALGHAPIESLDAFIEHCEALNIDSMIDMMNVEFPVGILRKLKRPPDVVILHRGVDEERFNKEKTLPLHEIQRVKGAYDIMIAVAGGDTIRDVQRAMFNDADIAVVWKSFYQNSGDTGALSEEFLSNIK